MRRLTGYIALAAFGALFSYGMLDGRAKNELVTDPIIVMLVMAGGAILPPLIVFLVRDRVLVWGNTWAEFWELPGVTRYMVPVALGITAVVVWDIVLLLIAGNET